MQCLTIRQPFAQLIVTGRKHIETRQWRTNYRGPLLIHASKTPLIKTQNLANGAFIGLVTLQGCFSHDELQADGDLSRMVTPYEREVGFFGPPYYAWWLTHPILFKTPIPAKGQLGIWTPPNIKELNEIISSLKCVN